MAMELKIIRMADEGSGTTVRVAELKTVSMVMPSGVARIPCGPKSKLNSVVPAPTML